MDRAIEFATLGEYGLEVPGAGAPAPGTGRSAHSVGRRPGTVASPMQPLRRVEAAQQAACAEVAQSPCPAAATAAGRRRGGTVPPAAQACVVAESG
jgi:hypothetical protein